MAGIPFLSRILALAGIKVRNASLDAPTGKEVNITVNPLQVGAQIDVELPTVSGTLPVTSQVILTTDRGSSTSPNAVASLVDGKVPTSQLPDIAITDVFVVPDEAARLDLDQTEPTINVGDVAIQTDNQTTWMLTALPTSTPGNWQQIANANYVHEIVTPTGTFDGPTVTLNAATLDALDLDGGTLRGDLAITNDADQAVAGILKLREAISEGVHYVGLRAPVNLSDLYTLTLPTGHGSTGQVLATNGATGELYWTNNTAADAVTSVNDVLPVAGNVTLTASNVGAVAKAGDTMTGNLTLGTTSVTPGQTRELRFGELSPDGVAVGSDYVGFKAPDTITTSVIWTLPDANGAAGQVLTTSLSGALSWQNTVNSVNGSSGTVTVNDLVHPTGSSTFERNQANPSMSGTDNTAIGIDAADAITTGNENTALGSNALSSATTGAQNVAIGAYALDAFSAGANQNIAIGVAAMQSGSGSSNIAIGYSAGNNGNSNYSVALGYNTLVHGGSSYSAIIGMQHDAGHSGVVIIGNDSTGSSISSTAANQFILGTENHRYFLNGRVQSVLSLGTTSAAGEARFYESANSSTSYIGLKAASSLTGSTTYTLPEAPMTSGMILSSTTGGQLSWVDAIPAGVVTSVNGVAGPTITVQELVHPTTDSTFERGKANPSMTGQNNTAIGAYAGSSITNGPSNSLYGAYAGQNINSGAANVAIGYSALNLLESSNHNVAVGNAALVALVSGQYNVAIGSIAGNTLVSSSSYNTVINSGGAASASTLNGIVAIGRDSTGLPATASADNQFVLGTSSHKYQMPGKVETALSLSSTDAGGQVKFYESTLTYYAGLKASSSLAANVTWTLPTADGTARQVLITNGSGALSFTSLTTTDVAEGTNLYFTDQRARDSITGAASTIVSSNLTVDRALISNGSGKVAVSSVTSTELGHLSGVTSAIQTQINGKVSTSGDTMTGALSMAPIGTLPGETNEIRFLERAANGSNYVGFKAPDSIASDIIWTLPADNGAAANYTLRNNGSGSLYWSETIDAAARTRLDALEDSRGVYSGNLQTGDEMDISDLVGVGAVEYPIVQIYKNVSGVYENINVEFSFDSSTKTITFGEIADGPISVVIHVLALTTPYTTLSI
jgi:hypothetical protein